MGRRHHHSADRKGRNLPFQLSPTRQPDQRTVGHTLVLGQTGSGKTLGTAF